MERGLKEDRGYMYIRGGTGEEEGVTCIICLGWSSEKISLQRTQSESKKKQSRFY